MRAGDQLERGKAFLLLAPKITTLAQERYPGRNLQDLSPGREVFSDDGLLGMVREKYGNQFGENAAKALGHWWYQYLPKTLSSNGSGPEEGDSVGQVEVARESMPAPAPAAGGAGAFDGVGYDWWELLNQLLDVFDLGAVDEADKTTHNPVKLFEMLNVHLKYMVSIMEAYLENPTFEFDKQALQKIIPRVSSLSKLAKQSNDSESAAYADTFTLLTNVLQSIEQVDSVSETLELYLAENVRQVKGGAKKQLNEMEAWAQGESQYTGKNFTPPPASHSTPEIIESVKSLPSRISSKLTECKIHLAE